MELGSGGSTVSQQGGERSGGPEHCPAEKDGSGEAPDGPISNLPDTVLAEVLAGLGSAAEAARTSILAKRWSCLWPDLPVMIFRGIEPDKLRELLAKPDPSLQLRRLEIHVPRQIGGLAAAEVSSLLLAAQERRPTELVFDAGGITNQGGQDVPFELPFFETANSMDLRIWNRCFTLPPVGEFSSLESLTLSLCCVDPSVFLHKCPCLRKLDMGCYWMLDDVSILSTSLEELVLKDTSLNDGSTVPRHIEIATPMLKKIKLLSGGDRNLVIIKFLAPMVENLCYKYFSIVSHSVGYHKQWHLESLTIAMEMNNKDRQVNCASNGIHVLSLVVVANEDIDNRRLAKRSFVEEISRLPVNNFSVLKLELKMEGRDFGSMVVHLLKILNGIQRLQLVLSRNMEPFSENTTVAGNQDVSLTRLQEVEIEGFNVIHHDLDFLKLLLKSAPVLKILRIQLSSGVSQNGRGYKELCGLFLANASVKCFVNGGHEDREENLLLGPCI